ncbi:Calcium-transporting ATPase 10, plasma membrane-type [Blyttiomyces sp. JEL0837]|nr:Calcium-transporting ATPase 10, plasma membrane-type [Blyttiomyces sp. JEL0837]
MPYPGAVEDQGEIDNIDTIDDVPSPPLPPPPKNLPPIKDPFNRSTTVNSNEHENTSVTPVTAMDVDDSIPTQSSQSQSSSSPLPPPIQSSSSSPHSQHQHQQQGVPTTIMDTKSLDNARQAKFASIQAAQNKLPPGQYGITPEELGELCSFDARTNPHQLDLLNGTYGGVEGVACLLRSDAERGIKLLSQESAVVKVGGGHGEGIVTRRKSLASKITPMNSEGHDSLDMRTVDGEQRVAIFGANLIPPPKSETIFEIVWGTIIEDPILKVLLVGAIVVLALGTAMCPTEGWLEGLVIMIAVVIVLSVTAGNDYSKDKKFKKLLLLQSDKKVKVIRGGHKDEISSWDVMVGDVVEIVMGDEIPADGIFIHGNRLIIDESPLTGESIPVKKSPTAPFLFSGCQVSEGSGHMLVTGVGIRSSGGQIQELLNEAQSEETVLQKKLKVVAVLIGKIGVAAGIATFLGLAIRWAIDWAQGRVSNNLACQGLQPDPTISRIQIIAQDFVIGITVVVVAVPEGLPLAVTISLAFSMFKMIKDKCFVRHLDASETMGEATCICTDKTGTLTENKMTVVKVFTGDKNYNGEGSGEPGSVAYSPTIFEDNMKDLLTESMCLNSDCFIKKNETNGQDMFIGSATEGALLVFARKLGVDYDVMRNEVTKVDGGVWNFSSDRKRMSTLVVPRARAPVAGGGSGGKYRLYSKGASEIILGLCTHVLENKQAVPMSAATSAKLQKMIKTWASEGLRTIGIAYRDTDQMITTLESADGRKDDPEHDLIWVALIGIKDPLRKEVPGAVRQCQRAGLTIRMVTGDNILTASKIARECNILFGEGIALEGPVFRAMSLEEKIEVIPKLQVLARSSPADKHTLVSLLKELGEVVAVTGDGTNDAPALKEADIGFAMGIAGTQIARNACDIVLMDDNFVSLVSSIRWGRNVLNSVRKFLQFQLGVNLVAIVLTFVGSVTVGDSPLNTVQLLWVNLIMDSFGALALASDDPEDDILDHPPHARSESLLSTEMREYIMMQLVYQIVVLLTLLIKGDDLFPPDRNFHPVSDLDVSPSKRIKTMVFTTFIFLQIANITMSRQLNGELFIFKDFFKNPMFLGIVFVIVVVQVIGILVGESFLSTSPINWQEWVICLGLSFGNMVFTFFMRCFAKLYHHFHKKPEDLNARQKLGLVPTDAIVQAIKAKEEQAEAEAASGSHTAPVRTASVTAAGGHQQPHHHPQRSKWKTVQSAVVLIGKYQDVQSPDFEAKGPDPDFIETWMRFRKDTAALPTKTGATSRSLASLKTTTIKKGSGGK